MKSNDISQSEGCYENDLFEVFQNLWNQKLFIAMFPAFFALLVFCYTLTIPKTWTAEIHISDPSDLQVGPLNPPELLALDLRPVIGVGAQKGGRNRDFFLQITPEDLTKSFVEEVKSTITLLEFDSEREDSIFDNGRQLREEERAQAANVFMGKIRVTPPSKTRNSTAIALTSSSPDSASVLLNEYVSFINKKIINQRAEWLKLAIRRAIRANEFLIVRANRAQSLRLENYLASLERALRIAKSVDVEGDHGLFVEGFRKRLPDEGQLHLLGERFLKAEIHDVKARLSRKEPTTEISDLQAEIEMLMSIVIDTKTASSFTLVKPGYSPTSSDQVNTKPFWSLALVLGCALGVLIAHFRAIARIKKTKSIV